LARLKPTYFAFLSCSVIFLAVSVFLFQACSTRQVSLARKRPDGIHHIVRPGENLYRIGKAYGIEYSQIAKLNGIKDPGQIRVGETIFIPGANRQLPVEIITPANVVDDRLTNSITPTLNSHDLIWPIVGKITSGFGPRGASFHDGIDISAPEGSPIKAVEKGEVIYSDKLAGYGNLIILRHSNGLTSVYSHNKKNLVKEETMVDKGAIVAEVGSTGRVTGPHLHFEIRVNNLATNPLSYLPSVP